MTAILDFANTPALSDSRLDIHLKSEEYDLFYICAKFCSFGRICPRISLTAPTICVIKSNNVFYNFVLNIMIYISDFLPFRVWYVIDPR